MWWRSSIGRTPHRGCGGSRFSPGAHVTYRRAGIAAIAVSLFALSCHSGNAAGSDGGIWPDVPPAEAAADVLANPDITRDGDNSDDMADGLTINVVLPPGAVRVVLEASPFAGPGQGYDIRTNRVLESENGISNEDADFYLLSRQIISLISAGTNPVFCKKGAGFTSVLDVPVDPAGCLWGLAELGGNGVRMHPQYASVGFLVRDRDGMVAARLVIVSDLVHEDTHAEVTFDLARIEVN